MRAAAPSSGLTRMQIVPPNEHHMFQFHSGCLSFGLLFMVLHPGLARGETATEPPRAAVFSDALPGFDQTLTREISGQLQAAGYTAEFITSDGLTNQKVLTAKRYDLL